MRISRCADVFTLIFYIVISFFISLWYENARKHPFLVNQEKSSYKILFSPISEDILQVAQFSG